MKASEIEEDWSALLERIHGPLPLSENLIARYPTEEPLTMKAERPSYTQRGLMSLGKKVDRSSRRQTETTGKEKLGAGKTIFLFDNSFPI